MTKYEYRKSLSGITNTSRRNVLLSVAGTGLLGKQWVRPLVDSVILPAHAATTSLGSMQYFDDISSRIALGSASRALLCVTLSDQGYIGQLALTLSNGKIDVFSSPLTPLGEISTMIGQCQTGGPFLVKSADQQNISISFEEGIVLYIPASTCELPSANCNTRIARAATPLTEPDNGMLWHW